MDVNRESPKCVACGEEMTEGPCIGNLCYYCIEKAVIYYKKSKEGSGNE